MGLISEIDLPAQLQRLKLQNIPAWAFIVLPIVYYLGTFIITGIRNIYFHPLSHIPGPKRAASSSIWSSYVMMSGRQPHIIKALHDRYGPIVRVGVNTVSFSTARAWKDIYGHIPSRPQFLKSPVYANEGTNKKVLSIVSELDPHKHGKIRRLQSHAFSAKALNEQEGVVQSYVDKLIRQIGVHATGENGEEMVKWFNFATFDIIGDLAFGEPFGSLDDGKPHFWVSMILDAMTAAAWKMVIFRYIGSSRITKYIMPKSMQEKREKHFKYSRDKIERRMKLDNARPDFMSRVLAEKDKSDLNIDVEWLTMQSSTLIVAGSETTATFLSGVTYHLCTTPLAYHRLVSELRSTFTDYSQITGAATEKCVYLKAVIDEGLRIYPPVPFALPRISPGETVDGVFIPAGAEVGVTGWAATHSEKNFHRPYDFIPERWIDKDNTDNKDASQPFLLGSRVCLGRNLALTEMRLILAKMLWVYDMELTNLHDLDWERDCKANPLWRKAPLMVKFTRREGIMVPGVNGDE